MVIEAWLEVCFPPHNLLWFGWRIYSRVLLLEHILPSLVIEIVHRLYHEILFMYKYFYRNGINFPVIWQLQIPGSQFCSLKAVTPLATSSCHFILLPQFLHLYLGITFSICFTGSSQGATCIERCILEFSNAVFF